MMVEIISYLNNQIVVGWAQTLCYFIAFLILIWQLVVLNKQSKIQTKAILDSNYLRCQIDYTETLRLLMESDKSFDIYTDLTENIKGYFRNWNSYNDKQKKMYCYFMLLFELFERVFTIKKKGGMDDIEWGSWDTWIKEIAKHPLFFDLYQDNIGFFNHQFEEYIKKIIDSNKTENNQL